MPCQSAEVVDGCEKFLCQLVSTKKCQGETAGEVRWKSFKAQSGSRCIDKMPPTSGAWHQVILRAHSQASAWYQDIICNPIKLDPCDLDWYMSESKFMPKLSDEFSAPSAVVELVKCGCVKSKCLKKCSCKQNKLPCTELCRCEGGEDCENSEISHGIIEDTDSDCGTDN